MVTNDAYFSSCHFDIRATCGMVLSWIKSRIWAFSLESACFLGSHRNPPWILNGWNWSWVCVSVCPEMGWQLGKSVFSPLSPSTKLGSKTFNRWWVIDGPLKWPLQADWLFNRLTEIPRTNSMVLAWGSAMPANRVNQTFLKLPISNVQQWCFWCLGIVCMARVCLSLTVTGYVIEKILQFFKMKRKVAFSIKKIPFALISTAIKQEQHCYRGTDVPY